MKEPSQYQVDCQKPKNVLLSTGEMFEPYAWAVRLISFSLIDQQRLIASTGFLTYLFPMINANAASNSSNSNTEAGKIDPTFCTRRFVLFHVYIMDYDVS